MLRGVNFCGDKPYESVSFGPFGSLVYPPSLEVSALGKSMESFSCQALKEL